MSGFLRSPHCVPEATPCHIPPPAHRVPTSPRAPSTCCLVWAHFPAVVSGGPAPARLLTARWPLPRASPCRTSCRSWAGPSGSTSCGPCPTPASAPCALTASTQVTLSSVGPDSARVGGSVHTVNWGPPGGTCSGLSTQGVSGQQGARGLKGGHIQVTLLTPLIGSDIVPKEVKIGRGGPYAEYTASWPPKVHPYQAV